MLDTSSMSALPGGYLNPFSSWQDIVSGLAWGIWLLWYATYHYQIHVHQITEGFEKSAKIGNHMDSLIVFFATLIGVIGRLP